MNHPEDDRDRKIAELKRMLADEQRHRASAEEALTLLQDNTKYLHHNIRQLLYDLDNMREENKKLCEQHQATLQVIPPVSACFAHGPQVPPARAAALEAADHDNTVKESRAATGEDPHDRRRTDRHDQGRDEDRRDKGDECPDRRYTDHHDQGRDDDRRDKGKECPDRRHNDRHDQDRHNDVRRVESEDKPTDVRHVESEDKTTDVNVAAAAAAAAANLNVAAAAAANFNVAVAAAAADFNAAAAASAPGVPLAPRLAEPPPVPDVAPQRAVAPLPRPAEPPPVSDTCYEVTYSEELTVQQHVLLQDVSYCYHTNLYATEVNPKSPRQRIITTRRRQEQARHLDEDNVLVCSGSVKVKRCSSLQSSSRAPSYCKDDVSDVFIRRRRSTRPDEFLYVISDNGQTAINDRLFGVYKSLP